MKSRITGKIPRTSPQVSQSENLLLIRPTVRGEVCAAICDSSSYYQSTW